jgi:hypothetical protein
MTPQKSSAKQAPQILNMPSQKMAVIYPKGDPNKVAAEFLPALYGSVYKMKFDLKKEVEH